MGYPSIYDSADNKLAVLNNIFENVLRRKINSYYEFDFQCYEEEFKSEYINLNNYVIADNDAFDIKAIMIEHDPSGKVVYDVKCEHVFYRLTEEEKVDYAFTGTPTEIMNDLLSGTEFSLGDIDYSESIVFAVNTTATIMNIIIVLANTLGAKIGFSDNGFTINIVNEIGVNNDFQVRIKKNMSGLKYNIDNRGELRVTYEVDIVNIYESEELKDLEFSEEVAIGDTITVINEMMGIETTQAVFEVEKDVISNRNLKITLGNSFDSLADEFSFLSNTAVKTDSTYYGVKINNELGIEIERDDKLARTKLNADEFRMQTGDGVGNYVDNLFFDLVEEKWKFTGVVETADLTVLGNMFFGDSGAATGLWFVGKFPFMVVYQRSTDGALVFTGDVVINGDLTVDGSIN